jgi:hypothetical protein
MHFSLVFKGEVHVEIKTTHGSSFFRGDPLYIGRGRQQPFWWERGAALPILTSVENSSTLHTALTPGHGTETPTLHALLEFLVSE